MQCSHWTAIRGDQWADDMRLSDTEPQFVCTVCGGGADVRPDFDWESSNRLDGLDLAQPTPPTVHPTLEAQPGVSTTAIGRGMQLTSWTPNVGGWGTSLLLCRKRAAVRPAWDGPTIQLKAINGGSWQYSADTLNVEVVNGEQVVRGKKQLPNLKLLCIFVLLNGRGKDDFHLFHLSTCKSIA